jgi:hypothetical protein
MDDDKLRMILAELNDQLTGGEARSQITIAKPACYVCLTANKHGLVSFARTFLTAALLPESDYDSASNLSTTQLDQSHVQIARSDEELALGWIEHAHEVPMSEENIAAVRRQAWRNDRFVLLGCGLIGFVMMFLMTTGIVTWIAIINGGFEFRVYPHITSRRVSRRGGRLTLISPRRKTSGIQLIEPPVSITTSALSTLY